MQAVQAHNATRNQWLVSIKNQGTRVYFPENCLSTMVPIHPARVIHELRQIMPTNTILTVDTGAHTLFVGHYWETYGPRGLGSPSGDRCQHRSPRCALCHHYRRWLHVNEWCRNTDSRSL